MMAMFILAHVSIIDGGSPSSCTFTCLSSLNPVVEAIQIKWLYPNNEGIYKLPLLSGKSWGEIFLHTQMSWCTHLLPFFSNKYFETTVRPNFEMFVGLSSKCLFIILNYKQFTLRLQTTSENPESWNLKTTPRFVEEQTSAPRPCSLAIDTILLRWCNVSLVSIFLFCFHSQFEEQKLGDFEKKQKHGGFL